VAEAIVRIAVGAKPYFAVPMRAAIASALTSACGLALPRPGDVVGRAVRPAW